MYADTSSLRLFVSFDTPPQVKRIALDVIETLRHTGADVSWENEHKLHCTVKFLGSVSSAEVPRLTGILTEIAAETGQFTVRYKGLGFFPPAGDPRVVWMGIEDIDGILVPAQRQMEDALSALGIPKENRVFHPHLTLGRLRSPRHTPQLIRTAETVTFEPIEAPIPAFHLMRSTLLSSGSVYTTVQSFPLIGNRR